jgi:malate dehydrogenase (oxaloacetate-decarboxylating)(NADP+)
MHADTAFNEDVRDKLFPNSRLKGRANLYVCPNLDAANIGYNITRVMTEGVALGPILMGVSKPAHILTPAATVRRVVNMTAIAAVEAQIRTAQTNISG